MSRTVQDIEINDRIGIHGGSGARTANDSREIKRGFAIRVSKVVRCRPGWVYVEGFELTATGKYRYNMPVRGAHITGHAADNEHPDAQWGYCNMLPASARA